MAISVMCLQRCPGLFCRDLVTTHLLLTATCCLNIVYSLIYYISTSDNNLYSHRNKIVVYEMTKSQYYRLAIILTWKRERERERERKSERER